MKVSKFGPDGLPGTEYSLTKIDGNEKDVLVTCFELYLKFCEEAPERLTWRGLDFVKGAIRALKEAETSGDTEYEEVVSYPIGHAQE